MTHEVCREKSVLHIKYRPLFPQIQTNYRPIFSFQKDRQTSSLSLSLGKGSAECLFRKGCFTLWEPHYYKKYPKNKEIEHSQVLTTSNKLSKIIQRCYDNAIYKGAFENECLVPRPQLNLFTGIKYSG